MLVTLQVIDGSSSTSAGFDATWHWPVGADAVHSFPHVTLSSDHLPARLSNISALRLAAVWAMSAGTISTARQPAGLGGAARVGGGLDAGGLDDVGAKANVAFDMFLDPDDDDAQSATAAMYEMMVWIGQVGRPYPLGFDSDNATCYTQQLGSLNL